MRIQKGFTLIELLVVISIIAILSAVGLSVFQGSQRKAADAQYKATVRAIQSAAEQAYSNSTTSTYQAAAAIAPYLESGSVPTGYTYTTGGAGTLYCVRSPALKDILAGNCSSCAAGVADIGSATTYFCAKNLQ